MKSRFFFVITLLFCIFFNQLILAEITGDVISPNMTGKATSQEVALSVFVQMPGGIPSIDITSPKNNTYLRNESILLNYTLVNGDYMWYNLDNSANITLDLPIYLNVSQGQHTIYVYSNNTHGLASSQLSFIANSSRFVILFEEYRGLAKGSSTNFFDYTYEEIQNLNRIVLENANYGKVLFNEVINITNDNINTDDFIDLDLNTEISQNNIELNSTEITNFNKSATIWLYNLGFTNPRILKGGEVCPIYVCTKESYSGGILKFNVTHFTSYSAEETPSGTTPGGGSEGGTREEEEEVIIERGDQTITMSPAEIRVSLKQGDTIRKEFYLTNNYNRTMNIRLEVEGDSQFIKINETSFNLSPGETKSIEVNFTAGENTFPDNYVGRIIVRTSGQLYEAITLIDVQSKAPLFDVSVLIKNKDSLIFPGESISFKTTISNVGESIPVKATIKYILKDINEKIIFENQSVENIINYLERDKVIKLPRSIHPGKYVLSVSVEYKGKIAVTSADFQVEKRKLSAIWKIILPILIIIITLIILWAIGKKEVKKEKLFYEREERLEYRD